MTRVPASHSFWQRSSLRAFSSVIYQLEGTGQEHFDRIGHQFCFAIDENDGVVAFVC